MSKRTSAKLKVCRKLGVNLWGREKSPFLKRNYIPGEHGPTSRVRASDYGIQLKAKQKLRLYYGNITEKQFKNIFKLAAKRPGDKAENFIGLLESRLDILVYRANFVPTVFAARQFISHKHVTVNGNIVNIASYKLKVGDVVEVRKKSQEIPMVIESLQNMEREVPAYIEVDPKKMSAKYAATPAFEDVPYPVEMEPHLIVEYYSR